MSYEQKIQTVKLALISYVKGLVLSSRYNNEFEFHTSSSYYAIKEAYVSKFKEVFSEYMNEDIEARLWFAGQNIEFVIQAFIDMNPNYTHSSLNNFVEAFLQRQLNEFENWCDDIMIAMPDEENQEDNPS